MGIVSLRLNETEEEIFRSYAIHTGKSLSELFKSALIEQIEDQLDYEIGIKALKKFQENPVLSDDALKQLKKMDRHVGMMLAKDLKKRLDGLENPRQFGKALVGDYKGLWRYRVGNYRVICDIIDNKMVILALEMGHRKDIYRK